MLIIGATDKRNGPASPCLVPLALFFTILGIGLGLGLETGWAVNPARDRTADFGGHGRIWQSWYAFRVSYQQHIPFLFSL